MEVLQMLKFWLKKDRLDFTKGWITPQHDMLVDKDKEDLLAQFYLTTNTHSADQILRSIAKAEGDGMSNIINIFE